MQRPLPARGARLLLGEGDREVWQVTGQTRVGHDANRPLRRVDWLVGEVVHVCAVVPLRCSPTGYANSTP